MFALLIVFLLLVNTACALQCITNCSIYGRFGEPFRISDGQCQQRTSLSKCLLSMSFQYNDKTYSINFDKIAYFSYDYIYITSGPYLSYQIDYACSESTNCPVVYAQKRVDEMVARNYDARRIYEELALHIDNRSRNSSIQCYDSKNNIITCSPKEICSLKFDTGKKKMTSRGCEVHIGARVFLFDGDLGPSITIDCNRNLCNTDATLNEVKDILTKNGLTDINGRRISAGTKQITSYVSLILALICAFVSHF